MSGRKLLAGILVLSMAVPAPLWAQAGAAAPESVAAPESAAAPGSAVAPGSAAAPGSAVAPGTDSPETEAQREAFLQFLREKQANDRAVEAGLASARLQEAYDAGKDVGIGVPLIVYGSLYTLVGLLVMAMFSTEGDSDADAGTLVGLLITGIGAAQLVPGSVLVHGGRNNRARYEVAAGPAAYDAGYDHGVGRTLVIYGGLFLFSALSMLAQDDADSSPTGSLIFGGAQVAYGAYAWTSGVRAFDRLREAPSPPGASRLPPAPHVATVLRLSF